MCLALRSLLLLLLFSPALLAGECSSLPQHLFLPFRMPDSFDGRSPTRFWRRAKFSLPCQGLNLCYSRLGAERSLCDQSFQRELETVCSRTYDQAYEETARARCMLAVKRWGRALRENQGEAFRDAQYEARWLEESGLRKVPRPKRKWLTEERTSPVPDGIR